MGTHRSPRVCPWVGGRVVHGPEPGTSSGRNLPFFWNRNGLESIFYLTEREQAF